MHTGFGDQGKCKGIFERNGQAAIDKLQATSLKLQAASQTHLNKDPADKKSNLKLVACRL
jgi:hypothetical protein